MGRSIVPIWPTLVGLAVTQAAAAAPGSFYELSIQARANPPELSLPSIRPASIDVEVRDRSGAPVSGAALDILARIGRVSPVREVGCGHYAATYFPPEERYPQLEILAIRIRGRGRGWLAIPLHGTGTLEVETDAGAQVKLMVNGKEFGPVEADSRGKAIIPFKAPPGLREGTLITGDGASNGTVRTVDLGVPHIRPILVVAGAPALAADGIGNTQVDMYVLDRNNQPLADARLKLSSEAGRVSSPVERAPGWYSAQFTVPDKVGSGLARLRMEVEDRGSEYHAELMIVLKPGPAARVVLSAQPDTLRADGRSRALIQARVEDRTGNRVPDAEVHLSTSAGKLGPVKPGEDGNSFAWLKVPGGKKLPQEVKIQATAVAPGSPTASGSATVRLVDQSPLLPPTPFWKSRAFYQWTALGAGVAAVVPGAVLLALDGKETCSGPSNTRCPEVYRTLTPGSILLGVGASLLGAALVLELLPEPEESAESGGSFTLQLEPGPSGLFFSGSWSF